jgi:hypothetical protein
MWKRLVGSREDGRRRQWCADWQPGRVSIGTDLECHLGIILIAPGRGRFRSGRHPTGSSRAGQGGFGPRRRCQVETDESREDVQCAATDPAETGDASGTCEDLHLLVRGRHRGDHPGDARDQPEAAPRRRSRGHARGGRRDHASDRARRRPADPGGDETSLVSRVRNSAAVPGCISSRCGVLDRRNIPDIAADLRPCLAGDSLGNCMRTSDSGH